MQLTAQQKRFFDEFGFLQFPGLLSDRIDTIIEDFGNVFTARGGGHNGKGHDGTARSCIVPFIDQSEGLSALVDDPRLAGIADSLLGDNWNYIGSDGNYYVGDTPWHSDGFHPAGKFIKIALYLDNVAPDTGALRVIPGSHQIDQYGERLFEGAWKPEELLGVTGRDVPSYALASSPGDVVVFNHNLFHSAWGGSSQRRMFTLNLSAHAETEGEIVELEGFINSMARFWLDEYYGPAMLATATQERKKHLQQVIEHSHELPALVAKAKETMSEPSRG